MKIFNNIFDKELQQYLKNIRFESDPQIIGKDKIVKHMELTLDNNSVHLDDVLAKQSSFNVPVVHGPLQSAFSTGWIHHIFCCHDYTYAKQVYQLVYNLESMPIGETIKYIFSCDELIERSSVKGKDPYLKVIYNIDAFVKDLNVMNIKWYIRYETSKFLIKNKKADN